jgi:hypothetical protein
VTLASKVAYVAADPRNALWEQRPARSLFRRYGRLARRAGLDELFLVLSFDCDTSADAEVAWEVHERLLDLGVCASYAVPGEVLERGHDVYRAIAETGAEFLNHGYLEHTVKEDGVYRSTVFYDKLTAAEVRDDVVCGHRAVERIAGRAPVGFRTPHFGTYQRPEQLRFLHGVLAGLGYRYSTSTLPLAGFRFGPAFKRFGLLEFPVSGSATASLEILDSWGCFAAPDRRRDAADYEREGRAVTLLYRSAGAGILSYYADPSQIFDQPAFWETVSVWRSSARPTSYRELVELLD